MLHTTPKLTIRTADDELMNDLTTVGLARVRHQQLTSAKHRALSRVQQFLMPDADEVMTKSVFGQRPCHVGQECDQSNSEACHENS